MRPTPKLPRRAVLAGLGGSAAALAVGSVARRSEAAAPPPAGPAGPPAFPADSWPIETADASTIQIDLPQLRHGGRWDPRPGAMRVLARELRLRTRLEPVAEPSTVESDSPRLFETPFLYVAGEGEMPAPSPAATEKLRRFIDLGGLVLFDAADGGTDGAFTRSVRDLLSKIAPSSELAPVGSDHVVFRSFYLVDSPMGRTRTHDHMLGIQEEGRLRVLLMRNDFGGALAETPDGLAAFPCTPGGADQREWAIRLAVNILLYATCTDYKADRAHVETLLRARRWR